MEQSRLLKIGAIGAILFVVFWIISMVLIAVSDVGRLSDSTDLLLQSVNGNMLYITSQCIGLASFVCLVPASVALYVTLGKNRPILLLAVIAILVAVFIQFINYTISMGMLLKLAPEYIYAVDTVKPSLVVLADTLKEICNWSSSLTTILMAISMVMFSITIIHNPHYRNTKVGGMVRSCIRSIDGFLCYRTYRPSLCNWNSWHDWNRLIYDLADSSRGIAYNNEDY